MNIDAIDMEILRILQEDSRLSFREIGEKTHLTGQAIGMRVTKMTEEQLIRKFTIEVDKAKLGINLIAMIKIYMKTKDHHKVKRLIAYHDEITEARKISGDGCYFIKVETGSNEKLNEILDEINEVGTYQLSLSIDELK